jgi:hypothetical protein
LIVQADRQILLASSRGIFENNYRFSLQKIGDALVIFSKNGLAFVAVVTASIELPNITACYLKNRSGIVSVESVQMKFRLGYLSID